VLAKLILALLAPSPRKRSIVFMPRY